MTYHVYMLTNYSNKVLYIGVTNNLERRFFEYQSKLTKGFVTKYNLNKLVYLADFPDVNEAIAWEKTLKGLTRAKKNKLIEEINPDWKNLINCHLW